ncbi:MAG TPA: sugar porter family MFS transporter [Bryobacteraceae bacterium]|nr:sugar porter family MFS transporter [Bryobacteraceae bacterium]
MARFNRYLVLSALVAALGGLMFGFDTAVIAGTTRALTNQFHLTPALLGFTVSAALWGTVLGSIFAGPPADRYGRRACLKILAILYLLSALGCAFAFNWYAVVAARVLGGLAIGASSVVGPMYIAEIAPAHQRGRMVGLFQFNIVSGILVAYLSNYLISLQGFGEAEWRWKLGIAALPAAVFVAALFGIPESPRWLARQGRPDEALAVLKATGDPNPEQELHDILASLHAERGRPTEALFQRKYAKPIFLAVSIGMFNQLSGINAILYYVNDIFERAGFSRMSSDVQAVGIGFTNLVCTILAMSVIDRLGRKRMLLIGAAGTAICLAGVATVFATQQHESWLLWFLVGFIGFFGFSQGAVIWVYLSEVFPNLVRAKGQSLGSFTHWIMNAMIAAVFPVIAARSGAAPFAFFAAMTVVQFGVVLATYPETKGVTLEAMQKKLGIE